MDSVGGLWVGSGPEWMSQSTPWLGEGKRGPLSSTSLSPCPGWGSRQGREGTCPWLLREQNFYRVVVSWVEASGSVWGWGWEWGRSGGYLLEADGQQLSHEVGPFTHGDGGSCKPVVEAGEGGRVPSDPPFTSLGCLLTAPWPPGPLCSRTTDQEFLDLILSPSQHEPEAAWMPGPVLGWAGSRWWGVGVEAGAQR